MDNARAVVIIGMLMAVLLSAFAAERLRVCHGERRCMVETTPGLLPAARFFMVRAENRAGASQTQPQTQTQIHEIQAQPRPTAATLPGADPTSILPRIRRGESDAPAPALP